MKTKNIIPFSLCEKTNKVYKFFFWKKKLIEATLIITNVSPFLKGHLTESKIRYIFLSC